MDNIDLNKLNIEELEDLLELLTEENEALIESVEKE
jgi:hypothetical protein